MYSRDIFPKYNSGGMPIPENYSGNAIRRTPSPQSHADRGQSGVARPSGQTRGTAPRAAVPLTVSPSFSARPMPLEAHTAQEQLSPSPAETVAEPREEREASREDTTRDAPRTTELHGEAPADETAVSASAQSVPHESGLSSLLSAFLPPKPGGLGLLSHIGLEEALLLGLFLLLSQSEEEEDTLMLLALLFLYR